MTITDHQFAEFLCCAHLSRHVDSNSFPARGGILLVSGSGQLKTTLLKILERYGDFRGISDLTIRGAAEMRDPMIDGLVNSLGFLEMRKLYERREDVAASMEMTLMAWMDEGFGLPNWKDQTASVTRAKCMVFGALTRGFYNERLGNWKDGMMRRIIALHYALENPEALVNSIIKWEHIALANLGLPEPPTTPIPLSVTEAERRHLADVMRRARGDVATIPLALMCKTASVMRWHLKRIGQKDNTIERMDRIAQMFSPEPITHVVFESDIRDERARKRAGRKQRRK